MTGYILRCIMIKLCAFGCCRGVAVSISYVQEKLWQALDTLVGAGSLQERLAYAAEYLIRLKIDEIPDRWRAEFRTVMDSLTRYPAEEEGDGSIRASVRKLTDEEGEAIARKIMSIYIDVLGSPAI
jgi:hypothetical protein